MLVCGGTVCGGQCEREGLCAQEMYMGMGGMMWCVCAEGWVVCVCTRLEGVCRCAGKCERVCVCAHEMCLGRGGGKMWCLCGLKGGVRVCGTV